MSTDTYRPATEHKARYGTLLRSHLDDLFSIGPRRLTPSESAAEIARCLALYYRQAPKQE